MPVNYRELATGKYYEELVPGNTYRHAVTRTITEADNSLFSAITCNTAWLHLDEEYCKTTIYGRRIVNSLFTMSLVCGMTVNDLSLGTTVANLGFSDVRFPQPIFVGDTIFAESEVIARRESKSRPETGIVEFETRGFNQRDELVVSLRRMGLMLKKLSTNAIV